MYPIVKKEKLADKIYLMDVKAPRVAQYCEPGQFVIVKMDEEGERIPLTICDFNREEGTITIYGNPKSYAAIQKHLEECGFEDVGGDFTYIPNDMKEVTPEQRETLDKMIERLEEFDDVQTVYTNMQPEEGE